MLIISLLATLLIAVRTSNSPPGGSNIFLNSKNEDPQPPTTENINVDMNEWDNIVYFKKQFVSYIMLPAQEQAVRIPFLKFTLIFFRLQGVTSSSQKWVSSQPRS